MEVVYEQCCVKGCGHSPFPMSEKFQDRCRKTHEFFCCPAGHSQHYVSKSDEEKLRDKVKSLRGQLETAQWNNDALRRQIHRCPWVGCSFIANPVSDYDMRAMWSHLRQAHGMPTKSEAIALREEQQNEG